ncbi:MAG: hypothetical protein KGZ97_03085 [Bacteroidetes bacterium]|nr:hypothetical protein [Bacteroidota bacterium]
MIRFIIKICFFLVLFVSIVVAVTYYFSYRIVNKHYFENFDTEENIVIIPKNKHFDILFLGISHARNFTRYGNHDRVEEILNVKMLNLGKGGGKGTIANQHNYLRYFLCEGNSVDHIIYVLTMPMFYSNVMDSKSSEMALEAFSLKYFLISLFGPGINKEQKLYNYLRGKYRNNWKKVEPSCTPNYEKVLGKIDSLVIQKGLDAAYVNGLELDALERNKKYLVNTIKFVQQNNINITFIITPTLFGEWPGHEDVMAFMKEIKEEYNVNTYNFCCVYPDNLEYFYDHHHLNTPGVIQFTKEYLSPLVDSLKQLNPRKDLN